MKQLIRQCAIPLTLAMIASPAFADHMEENSALQDAWLDGKLDTVIVLNQELNPLGIDTDVVDGVAIVTGKVTTPVQKSLMNDLALGVVGINSVDNRLMVDPEHYRFEGKVDPVEDILDASITTAISTKLLLNSDVDSSRIDVDTMGQAVTLKGRVESDLNSNLVEQIARSTFDVEEVHNRLLVVK